MISNAKVYFNTRHVSIQKVETEKGNMKATSRDIFFFLKPKKFALSIATVTVDGKLEPIFEKKYDKLVDGEMTIHSLTLFKVTFELSTYGGK